MVEKAALVNFHLLCYTFFVAVCVLQGMKFFKGDINENGDMRHCQTILQ